MDVTKKNQTEFAVSIKDLKKHYRVRTGFLAGFLWGDQQFVKAVDGLSLGIMKRRTFGLVGESGCGKSTLGRCILRLEPITEGTVTIFGQDIHSLPEDRLRDFRKKFQMIFQNPYSTLPPHKTVGNMLKEVVDYHQVVEKAQAREYCLFLLRQVGLDRMFYDSRPKAMSGGQRQRAAIARALSTDPKLIVLDEPVTALDISIQAQILNLLLRLQEEKRLTYLFITHDLSVVRHVSDVIGVMYLGKMMELMPARALGKESLHPYTKSLISSSPVLRDFYQTERVKLIGELPSAIDPPSGCKFHTRCPYSFDRCHKDEPRPVAVDQGHLVSCFLFE